MNAAIFHSMCSSSHRLVTFLCQVSVEHQLSVSQVVEHWPKVGGVSVDEIGTGFILENKDNDQMNTVNKQPNVYIRCMNSEIWFTSPRSLHTGSVHVP